MLAIMRDSRAKPERRDAMALAAAPYVHPPVAPLDISNLRLIGGLLAEIVKFHGGPAKQ